MNTVWYALGAVLLGIIGLNVGDFALQWQPVPDAVPLRTPLAYLSAALLVAAGATILYPPTSRIAALWLGFFYGLWVVLLKIPEVFAHPAEVVMWLGFAEIVVLAMGGIVAWSMSDTDSSRRALILRVAQVVFGICLLTF